MNKVLDTINWHLKNIEAFTKEYHYDISCMRGDKELLEDLKDCAEEDLRITKENTHRILQEILCVLEKESKCQSHNTGSYVDGINMAKNIIKTIDSKQ